MRRTDPSHEAEKADKIRQGVWALAKTGRTVLSRAYSEDTEARFRGLTTRQSEASGRQMVNLLKHTLPLNWQIFIAAHCLMTEGAC